MDESRGPGQLERLRDVGSAAGNDGADGPAHHDRRSALIEFRDVSHTYRSFLGRAVRAVESFDLTIQEGEIFGLAGPNGAGKSTLIALMLGYLEPTRGTVRTAGMRPRAYVERFGVGYLSELVSIPPRWTLTSALRRYAALAGIAPREVTVRVANLIELLGLDEHRDKRVRQLSKGNLQRLGLAQALLHEEQLLILDEPTHGLDPVWSQRFRDVVEQLRRPGRVIFIASHNLDELQRLADRVAIIDHGELQRVVSTRATAPASAAPYLVTIVGDARVLRDVFPAAIERGTDEFELPPLGLDELNAGVAALLQRGVLVSSLRPSHSVLEQHFREAVR